MTNDCSGLNTLAYKRARLNLQIAHFIKIILPPPRPRPSPPPSPSSTQAHACSSTTAAPQHALCSCSCSRCGSTDAAAAQLTNTLFPPTPLKTRVCPRAYARRTQACSGFRSPQETPGPQPWRRALACGFHARTRQYAAAAQNTRGKLPHAGGAGRQEGGGGNTERKECARRACESTPGAIKRQGGLGQRTDEDFEQLLRFVVCGKTRRGVGGIGAHVSA